MIELKRRSIDCKYNRNRKGCTIKKICNPKRCIDYAEHVRQTKHINVPGLILRPEDGMC